MRLDVSDLVTGRGRYRLQRADLVGDQVFDLRGLHARKRPSAKAVQVAVTGMRADADAARFCKLHGPAHDVRIAGMEAAGDVDRGGKLDHGGVIAHLPCAKSFAEIAIEIDCCHVRVPLREWILGQSCASASADGICHVPASMALTAAPATLASCSASLLRSKASIGRTRSGRLRSNCANLRASLCASAMLTALKRKPRPAGICANRPRSPEITVAILG